MINAILNDRAKLEAIELFCPVKAKKVGTVHAKDRRVLMPQPIILQILHSLFYAVVEPIITSRLEACGLNQVVLGAAKGNQDMDITFGVQRAIERVCDESSDECSAQCDVQQYYDTVPVMFSALALIHAGLHPSWG